MEYVSGTYTGNNTDNTTITGLGFQPDVVIIWGNTTGAKVFKTSTAGFSGDKTTTFTSTTGTFAGAIKSLDADGFTLGTHSAVNGSGITYYWAAFQDDGNSDFAVGQYTGNSSAGSNDNRNITVGFAPKFVFLKRIDTSSTKPEFRLDSMAVDESWTTTTIHADYIQDFGATTFQVGTNAGVNANGGTYAWVAFGYGTATTYTGNNVNNTSITGVGFDPTFMVIKEADASTMRGRVDSISTDVTLKYTDSAAFASNEIQQFVTDGFELGNDSDVNASGVNYHYFATKSNPLVVGGSVVQDIIGGGVIAFPR